ncbi:Acetyltransferase [Phaeobacter piscinae]|uniref:Acetyltransferase n=1 Tax=Phaeobacter piscinae TaxID=1580596 RepID=A0AAN1GT21_9RHOB|nr:GNAT family N-acetyltransferase [Phaeobacter piscinae]ATG44501.1 Acetyltransferase [Phaeobacter piscinae]AUR36815.1 Acetyltransferase [Phaeobacter piscinae]
MTDHPDLTLRVADMADASSLAALSLEVWIGTYMREGVSGFFADYVLAELTAARFAETLADPQEHVIVSQNRVGIDGYIRISRGRPGPTPGCSDVEITTLYVQPRHHGRGIGAALLRAGLAHCAEEGVARVWLASNAENTPAKAFYLSQGFERVGETQFVINDQSYLNDVFTRDCLG